VINLYKEFLTADKEYNIGVAFRDCLSSERKTKVFLDLVKAVARVEAPIRAAEVEAGVAKMR